MDGASFYRVIEIPTVSVLDSVTVRPFASVTFRVTV